MDIIAHLLPSVTLLEFTSLDGSASKQGLKTKDLCMQTYYYGNMAGKLQLLHRNL